KISDPAAIEIHTCFRTLCLYLKETCRISSRSHESGPRIFDPRPASPIDVSDASSAWPLVVDHLTPDVVVEEPCVNRRRRTRRSFLECDDRSRILRLGLRSLDRNRADHRVGNLSVIAEHLEHVGS